MNSEKLTKIDELIKLAESGDLDAKAKLNQEENYVEAINHFSIKIDLSLIPMRIHSRSRNKKKLQLIYNYRAISEILESCSTLKKENTSVASVKSLLKIKETKTLELVKAYSVKYPRRFKFIIEKLESVLGGYKSFAWDLFNRASRTPFPDIDLDTEGGV
jgi:hypothetical protein